MITSTSNSQIKNLIQLQKKGKLRTSQNAFVIEGVKMFEESLEGGLVIKAYVSDIFYSEKILNVPNYFNTFPYEIVQDSVLKEASDTLTPQGIMAIVHKPNHRIESILEETNLHLMLLEDLRDPGNLGTIIRTAEGAGVTGVILSKESVDMYNPKVIRSTMGAIYRMPFVYVDNFIEVLQELKEKQISIYAAHLEGEKNYDEIIYGNRIAIMIGNEANGISEKAKMVASELIRIPMQGKVESLNAAIAGGILMYEVFRQQRKKH